MDEPQSPVAAALAAASIDVDAIAESFRKLGDALRAPEPPGPRVRDVPLAAGLVRTDPIRPRPRRRRR